MEQERTVEEIDVLEELKEVRGEIHLIPEWKREEMKKKVLKDPYLRKQAIKGALKENKTPWVTKLMYTS